MPVTRARLPPMRSEKALANGANSTIASAWALMIILARRSTPAVRAWAERMPGIAGDTTAPAMIVSVPASTGTAA
ncbi:hypothetical protein [Streptomyces griseorubiginosus]|uniref:hypothetical protein n=1 Tax=Streptomyces griseorubiginosus TaxID=67304 RepID=UPI001AD7215B|nr:hypothetical protein [Streptomyces griseorubiginosus]MBO4257285.1 hypothetical protein [Streptomyces griseorubiginosus]